MNFLGYPRPDNSAGIRNYILIIPGGLISEKICAFVPGTKTFAMAKSGGGMTSRDREAIARTFSGFGLNPNVAGVILHNGSPGAGYPELKVERLSAEIEKSGKPVEVIDVRKEGGTLEAITKGVKLARRMVFNASIIRREPVDISKLCLGVKCGASDPTSGMVGNPVVGYLFDRIVDGGGTTMFGETTELIGAEHIVASRAVDQKVADEILEAVRFIENRALSTGEDIRTMNPVPENIAAGISSLEEKSLGAIYKAGHHPIQGLLKYAERPSRPGLYFVDNWMGPNSIFPGYAAAGAQLTIFQYGGGAAARTVLDPSPAVTAPLLWTSANPSTYAVAGESLDFYSGTVIEGKETIEEAGERLLALVIDIASGTLTRGETVNYADPIEVYGVDPLF
ncbi:MAG TPA: UxaA family hydrolase [Syntrophorhabdaceae bacterium]|nr:UxaA family hydrolase [Syntrophorhabdaceae bacterium]